MMGPAMVSLRHVNIAAASLLLIVTLSLLWNVTLVGRPSPTMISNFEFDSKKCELRESAPEAILHIARRSDADAETRLAVQGTSIRVSSRVATPGQALFEEQERALADSMNCGTSRWCEGLAPDDEYGAAQLPLLSRKRQGENVQLSGCELTQSDFHPVSFEIAAAPGRRLDAFVVFSILINLASIFLVMRGNRGWLRRQA